MVQCGLGLGLHTWCFGSGLVGFAGPRTPGVQSKLCLPAHTCCEAINSYHLFPFRLRRRRSCKLNVAPLLLFLKPQEDLHMQMTEPIFIAAHEKGERLVAVCHDNGSGNTKVKQRQQTLHCCTFCYLDLKEIHNGNAENLCIVKPLQGPHFQPVLQSKMGELYGLTLE